MDVFVGRPTGFVQDLEGAIIAAFWRILEYFVPFALATVGLRFRKPLFLYRRSEAGNEKYFYELYARGGLRFSIRHQEAD
jgi:hypothetical protein